MMVREENVVNVRLVPEEGDRIVVEYHGAVTKASPRPIQIVIANEGEHNVGETGSYVCLWKKPDDEDWILMWRGNWDTTSKYFMNMVGDMDAESNLEIRRDEEARLAAQADKA